MAKRKNASKKTTASKKRKPLADVSNTMITPKPGRKKNTKDKSKKIGEAEDTYVSVLLKYQHVVH